MAIEHIRLSQKARDQLIQLKRKTGIQTWNVLCRWAFCVSLVEPSIPPQSNIPADSSVEMDWKTFAGTHSHMYLALLKERCHKDGLGTADDVLSGQFRLHLHRGISYLVADPSVQDIFGLISKAALSASSN